MSKLMDKEITLAVSPKEDAPESLVAYQSMLKCVYWTRAFANWQEAFEVGSVWRTVSLLDARSRMSELTDKQITEITLQDLPRVGSRWRHYRGGLYEVVAVSLKEDTLEPLVTYRSLLKGLCWSWTRTFANWQEAVEVGGVWHQRFEGPLP
jgi:hypothetical protein